MIENNMMVTFAITSKYVFGFDGSSPIPPPPNQPFLACFTLDAPAVMWSGVLRAHVRTGLAFAMTRSHNRRIYFKITYTQEERWF